MALSVSVKVEQSDNWTTTDTGGRVAASITVLLYGLLILSACKQGVASSALTETGTGSASATTTVTPAPLASARTQATLSQAMASDVAFVDLVDRQGLSWSVEIGQAYNAASGKICRPLRLTSRSQAGGYDRLACSGGGGSWTMVTPLRGGDTGPRF